MTKDEHKAEAVNTFFTSIFNSKDSYFLDPQTPVSEDRVVEQNEALLIQEEMVRNMICHLDTHASLWG